MVDSYNTPANNISAVGYLLSVTFSPNDLELLIAIQQITGRGYTLHGFSNGTVSTELLLVPKGRKNRKEILTLLQALPAIRSVVVVSLSNPVKETELTEVRQVFAGINLDTTHIPNHELSKFINARLDGQDVYYIDYDVRKSVSGPVKISIKPLEEHPHFSPEWVDHSIKKELPDTDLKIEDLQVRSGVVESTSKSMEPPPPPPAKL